METVSLAVDGPGAGQGQAAAPVNLPPIPRPQGQGSQELRAGQQSEWLTGEERKLPEPTPGPPGLPLLLWNAAPP